MILVLLFSVTQITIRFKFILLGRLICPVPRLVTRVRVDVRFSYFNSVLRLVFLTVENKLTLLFFQNCITTHNVKFGLCGTVTVKPYPLTLNPSVYILSIFFVVNVMFGFKPVKATPDEPLVILYKLASEKS